MTRTRHTVGSAAAGRVTRPTTRDQPHKAPEEPNAINHRTIHSNVVGTCANDPSAGSPTETLLRLLLPLDVKVH